ncbi:MAG: hypothetical protein AUJ92_14455 [Armatimonadetes bacterium CG2_30_59_28]|nr:Gfo/Idh/MocA family oxidoreductase [Armatimonadota bacterium]OIO92361.1 MAG: hypothetical protein AUJ92_14455 [Armatimonadetes bacterium CG2_30_59_28]PIU64944.1 MAG: hypothetical protein COS85_10635 [Armatimonadetes bacterium CG07_land_8_20_14_0_80_59_28]PIX45927.1 MAG: hypothetical protein COZ56_00650 [Armatimonadetes bacterium CG_4_8_14_3_um_filter_58_9]PIY37120.1 MAG: hypothetical protein COZ05_22880 [Armatimonadetes bacterium CG_4_10_14_3_um_filter_59_10]PJB64932.1 MAG: hypothetical pro
MSVKVAFIGTGIIAQSHLETLSRDPDVKVVGLCDIVKAKAEAAARQFGGRAYVDYRKMLDNAEPDAVYLCVPPYAHEGQEFDIVERKMAMFVEKPVALDIGYGERVAAAVEAAGIVTSVGYVWRYSEGVALAKGLLRKKPAVLARGHWLGKARIPTWWGVKEKSGGQIVEQATHLFDLTRLLVGEMRRLYARSAAGFVKSADRDIEDASVVSIEFESGAVGEMTQTCVLNFEGSSGLELVSPGQYIHLSFDQMRIRTANKEEIYTNARPPLELENEAFINAVKTGDASGIRSNYMEGLQTLATTLAANYSMESGDVVRM